MSEIKEHMKIVGKDGFQVGTVDKVEETGSSSPKRTARKDTRIITTTSTRILLGQWKATW
jgi:hypothetical protein